MNENDTIAVIAAAWLTVQVTRLSLTYRAGQRRAAREAAKENKS